jgi:hypothetical protein
MYTSFLKEFFMYACETTRRFDNLDLSPVSKFPSYTAQEPSTWATGLSALAGSNRPDLARLTQIALDTTPIAFAVQTPPPFSWKIPDFGSPVYSSSAIETRDSCGLSVGPGFWTPVLYKDPGTIYEKVQTFVDDYFNFWGSWCLVTENGKNYSDKKPRDIHVATMIDPKNYPKHPLYETAIKIVSFCTFVIPLALLVVKIALRWKYSFNLNFTDDEGKKEAVKNLAWNYFMPRQT